MEYLPLNKEKVDDYIQLWNKELGKSFPMRKRLFIQNSFEDINFFESGSFYAVNEKNQVVGFIITKKWQEKIDIKMGLNTGWIQGVIVDSDFQNQGVGSNLLKKAEDALVEDGIKFIHIGRDPWHYFPGVPAESSSVVQWFERRGYHQNGGIEYDLLCEYDNNWNSPLPLLENVEFKLLDLDMKEDFLAFLNESFPGRWEYEAIHYFDKGGTGREFVIAWKDQKIIGFCRINDQNSPLIGQNVYWSPLFTEELGGIGPLGIDERERKNGYGLAVVQAAIHYLRKRRIDRIVIDWTGLVNFYAKLGYKPWQAYVKLSKEL